MQKRYAYAKVAIEPFLDEKKALETDA